MRTARSRLNCHSLAFESGQDICGMIAKIQIHPLQPDAPIGANHDVAHFLQVTHAAHRPVWAELHVIQPGDRQILVRQQREIRLRTSLRIFERLRGVVTHRDEITDGLNFVPAFLQLAELADAQLSAIAHVEHYGLWVAVARRHGVWLAIDAKRRERRRGLADAFRNAEGRV